jgi:aminoacylase
MKSSMYFMVKELVGVRISSITAYLVSTHFVYFISDVVFRVFGQPGHGSLLLKDTAAENLRILLGKIFDYRSEQENLLSKNPELCVGDITSLNVTKIKGGKQRNVLPPFMEVTVDIRIAVNVNHKDFEEMLIRWSKESGENVEIEYEVKEQFCPPTAIDDSNIYWSGFKKAIDDMNLKIKTQIFPAGTDSAYIRVQNIPALGFSPMNFTPSLLHDHDEHLKADIYLKGIEIYQNILSNIGNV